MTGDSAAARSVRPNWEIDPISLARFQASLGSGAGNTVQWHALRREAEKLGVLPAFEQLIALDMNRIKELPHQIRVAQQVLQAPMHGRAILADEVGLGKTIEAGIILKELAVRGLARRVLILTPASLVTQWVEELQEKFFETLTPIETPGDWRRATRAVASYDRAGNQAHRAEVTRKQWDLVIIDEAHKCKNHKTSRYKLLQELQRNYILLLTATPLQNNIRELYNLITLLRPGHLGTWKEFKRQYVAHGDVRQVANPALLRELTSRVMVRTRRSSVAHVMAIPPRRPNQPEIVLSADEAALYAGAAQLLRDLYRAGFRQPTEAEESGDTRRRKARTGKGIFFLECIRIAQRVCSSPAAAADSFTGLAAGELILPEFRSRIALLADQAVSVKQYAKLEALTSQLNGSDEQLVVFSEHLATVGVIVTRIREMGRMAIRFAGDLPREARQRALKKFKETPGAVLVSTRAGSEGLNLQFCHQMVNYELPWNPMIVEQRIGRIHRIGQTRESLIFNYAAKGTVEAHILRLLHTKIRLFELVVGELDAILGEIGKDDGETLEQQLGEMWISAESDAVFAQKVEGLGDEIVRARDEAAKTEQATSDISAEDSAGRLLREFARLSVPARVRFGYGTDHLIAAPGVEADREHRGIHVSEILDMLNGDPIVEMAQTHRDYGPLYRITGLSGRQREVSLLVQADRLPMTLVEISGDRLPSVHHA